MTQPIANARLRPMIAPILAPVIISAAITSVYAVIAPWMPVTVVPTSFATVAMETFITELSSVIRNWPDASVSRTSRRRSRARARSRGGGDGATLRGHRKYESLSHSQLSKRSRVPDGGWPRFERAMSGSKRRSSNSAAASGLRAIIMISELR